ncbi:MAG: cryptochrome/photolyase family protein, partial [Chitinophagaceae bacterium]|nr:cryptochrome/photolyase family protein [Chitinophagaceae bacterium]
GNAFVQEAREYVEMNFKDNYGTTIHPFNENDGNGLSSKQAMEPPGFYAVTFEEAEKALNYFAEERLALFGVYEDAMTAKSPVLYHSMLSPLLNTGLLTPQQVIDKVLDTAAGSEIPLNSLEGFIRQVTGWREFIRIVYEREGSTQRTENYWGFTRKIPPSFWKGNTGIHPVDEVIKKVLNSGYTHHIERLMVMGNFFLLCEFDPDDVYRWFMEMFIDAYDWVMVPNVYGMTQFADGGIMTTKPYISGSNYLMKMGDWNKGPWQSIWDGLFWRFMHVHRDYFLKNPRLGMLVRTFDKMDPAKRNLHLSNAESFLASLDMD